MSNVFKDEFGVLESTFRVYMQCALSPPKMLSKRVLLGPCDRSRERPDGSVALNGWAGCAGCAAPGDAKDWKHGRNGYGYGALR